VVIAAYTVEITFGITTSAGAARQICTYCDAKASNVRTCFSLMGVAISSIMVCMVLMILDIFIPCVDLKVQYNDEY